MSKIIKPIIICAASILCSAINSFAGRSVYTLKFDDPKGVFFTEEAFNIKADGKMDVSDQLQDAINAIKEERGFGVLYLPEGKYRISRTIYVPSAIRIVGYGKNRPELVLGKNTPGFSDEPTSMVWFTGGVVSDPAKVTDGNAGTFYSGISNVNVRIEKGNPMAIGLRTHVAQHGVFSHISIYGGDAYACLLDAGNEIEDVEFFGARYGITSGTSAPSWPVAMVDTYFEGQKEAALITRTAGIATVNMKVRNVPAGIICESGFTDRFYLEDTYFENVRTAMVVNEGMSGKNQFNLVNVYCKNVPVLADFKADDKILSYTDRTYRVNELVYGLISKEMGDDSEFGLICDAVPAAFPETFSLTIPQLPDMSEWVSLASYGVVGDGEADDTEAIQKAIDENDVVFVPEGWYRITKTLKMREGSVLVGLHPFSTQFVLSESTPAFSGFGSPVPMVESSKGGNDIFTGIGICTGGYNHRAVGMKWMAGGKSFLNDTKFVGGHGTMYRPVKRDPSDAPRFPMGFFFNMKVSSPTDPVAVQGLDQAWDNQYWSLWITDNGGGTFKDIWTANTYASAGLYVSNTKTPSRMFAISLEHHVRFESRWSNVENFKVYAMQYEEETREGKDCVAMTMDNCKNIMFANTWFYRVIRVMSPRDYGVLVSNCENIEMRNARNWTQIVCQTAATAYDMNKNISIYPFEFAYVRVSGNEASQRPEGKVGEAVKIGKDFQYVTGATNDSKGNVYFCEGNMRKVYKWDAESNAVTVVADFPYRPLSLAVDTDDNLIVVCRYPGQPGFKDEKIEFITKMKDDYSDYSGWGNGMWTVKAYSIPTEGNTDVLTELKKVSTASVAAERVIYPSHSLRLNLMEVYDGRMADECFVAPDGKTVVPYFFDLCRSTDLTTVVPGQPEPVYIALENTKTSYQFNVERDGSLKYSGVSFPRADYGIAYDKEGRTYLGDGQIFVLDRSGNELSRMNVEERPVSMTFGGVDNDYLFVTTNRSLYRIKVK